MTSRPDGSSQPTVPTEGPVAGHSSLRISRRESHQGQGQDRLPLGCLEPPPASLACSPWLAQNSHLQEGLSMHP